MLARVFAIMSDTASGVAGTRTILVVEDEPALRFVVSEFLREENGLDVIEAGNADEAMALFRSGRRVDLMFTDIRMPGAMDGTGLAAWAASHYPATRVITTSGHLSHTSNLPGIVHIMKPYDFNAVLSLIAKP